MNEDHNEKLNNCDHGLSDLLVKKTTINRLYFLKI